MFTFSFASLKELSLYLAITECSHQMGIWAAGGKQEGTIKGE